MSIEYFNRTIPTSGVVEFVRGNVCLLISATGAVDLRAEHDGVAEGFLQTPGGVLIRRIRPWNNLRISGAAGVTITGFVGSEIVDHDEVDIRLAIATIAGVASVAFNPYQAITNRAPVVQATGAQGVLFAANVLRRAMTVFVDENNIGTCYARTVGGANNIVNMQPGSSYDFDGIYGMDVRNDTGANATFYFREQS